MADSRVMAFGCWMMAIKDWDHGYKRAPIGRRLWHDEFMTTVDLD